MLDDGRRFTAGSVLDDEVVRKLASVLLVCQAYPLSGRRLRSAETRYRCCTSAVPLLYAYLGGEGPS